MSPAKSPHTTVLTQPHPMNTLTVFPLILMLVCTRLLCQLIPACHAQDVTAASFAYHHVTHGRHYHEYSEVIFPSSDVGNGDYSLLESFRNPKPLGLEISITELQGVFLDPALHEWALKSSPGHLEGQRATQLKDEEFGVSGGSFTAASWKLLVNLSDSVMAKNCPIMRYQKMCMTRILPAQCPQVCPSNT